MMAPEPIDPIGRTAAHLRAILQLAEDLQVQAIHTANHRTIPGGPAMIELAPIANLEAWEHQHATDERTGTRYTNADLEDSDDAWPAAQRIKWWAEQWRQALGAEYDTQIITLTTEVNFLRFHLEWAYARPGWDKFEDDVYTSRRRLEDILTTGVRDIISEDVTCLICDTHLRRRMTNSTGYEDEWWCVDCYHHLTAAQFNLAASQAARAEFDLDSGGTDGPTGTDG